ncbi:MAG: glycosyltransferase [Pseudomonadota bacterium]|nr:glycosyltransferase [Pseudomonadota bacterium]
MHLVDTSMFFAPEGGGVGRYLAVKHAWLKAHTRWRHTIVAPGGETHEDHDIRTYRAPLRVRHGYRFPLTRAAWSRRIVALQPDLIEAGDPYLLAWASIDAAQRAGVPAIGFYHSDVVGTAALRFGPAGYVVAARYARALYRQFDLVIAPSRHVEARLRELGVDRVACQPLGVDVQTFHPSRRREDLRETLGLGRDTRLLVFAGRFAREKNLDVLCSAMRLLGAPYHLLLIGSGEPPRAPANVTIRPYEHDPAALAGIVASCDAFLHAGDRETFGLVVLEAMACGLPVIAVGGGAITDLVQPHGGLVVGRRDAHALAEGISHVFAQDPHAMGQAARRWVESHYTWDSVLRGLIALYGRLEGAQTVARERAYATR